MSFQRFFNEIREKIGDEAQDLLNKDLIVKIHSFTKDYKWDFDKNEVKKEVSVEEAIKEKDKGTIFFRNNQLQEACDTYTNFIKMCHYGIQDDKDKTTLLHQGYANRSAVLFRANKYTNCLDDINGALYYSSDPKADYMVHDRKARCCMFLNFWSKARKAFKDALEGVELAQNLKQEIKEAFIAQVETQLSKIPTDEMIKEGGDEVDEDFVMDDQDFLIKMKKVHDFHPGLSDKILVKYTESKGRYTIANDDIKAGDVIAVEDANVSFTHYDNDQNESKACHHCVQALKVNKHPSPVIEGIYFCSFSCLNKAMLSYHKHEKNILKDYIAQCKNDEHLERSGCLFLALKAICKQPWTFYVDNKRSQLFLRTDPSYGVDANKDQLKCDENKILNLFNLVNHEDQVPSEERIKTAIRSVILLESLKQSGYFDGTVFLEDALNEQELIIGSLLYKLQIGITYNVHLIYRVSGDLSGGIPLDMVGSAVYHNCVLLNHSCAANTTRLFQGGQMVLVAKRSIKKGEEVTNNYGIHHHNMPKVKRQSSLKNGYKFECDCEACQEDFPLLNKVESSLPSKKVGKDLDALIGQYQKLFSQGWLEEALDRCRDYIFKLEHSGVKYPHRNYEIGAIAMNSCWWGIIARQSQMSGKEEEKKN